MSINHNILKKISEQTDIKKNVKKLWIYHNEYIFAYQDTAQIFMAESKEDAIKYILKNDKYIRLRFIDFVKHNRDLDYDSDNSNSFDGNDDNNVLTREEINNLDKLKNGSSYEELMEYFNGDIDRLFEKYFSDYGLYSIGEIIMDAIGYKKN